MNNIHRLIYLAFTVGLIASCSDTDFFNSGDSPTGDIIHVEGIDTDEMTVSSSVDSRTTDGTPAEQQSWLVQPLMRGLDITYGLFEGNEKTHSRVAILKLKPDSESSTGYHVSDGGLAEYIFRYRDDQTGVETDDDATWYDNGAHFFEGLHVPQRIRFSNDISEIGNSGKAPGLSSDQHDATDTGDDSNLGNYTLLAHYLGMPASTHIAATVSRIKLPFQHRLARVLVFILIDPNLGENTKINGYNIVRGEDGSIVTPDDPASTSIRFCNVDVLGGVRDIEDQTKGIHTLTPIWVNERKVVPHFMNERGTPNLQGGDSNPDFIAYYNIEKKEYIYGTSSDWQTARDAYRAKYNASTSETEEGKKADAEKSGYREINYGKVPLYDIIVRPTYTTIDNVMYDEDLTEKTASQLVNYQNSIDFDITLTTGLQYEKKFEFDLNANQQTAVYLRISGESVDYDTSGSESWVEDKERDDWYGLDNENGNTLSKSGSSWQRAFTNASTTDDKITDGGHYSENTAGEDGTSGQYLTQATWKKFLSQAYEGGEHHGDYFILSENISIDASELPANFIFTGHLDGRNHTITFTGGSSDVYDKTTDYNATELYYKENVSDSQYLLYSHPDLYICEEIAQAKSKKTGTTNNEEGEEEEATPPSIPAGSEMMTKVTASLADIMNAANTTTYYRKNSNGSYSVFNPRTWTFYTHRIGAGSLFCGLNGSYTTNQESANPKKDANGKTIWEANVHKETNKKTYWVPTTGWRAEVLNVKVSGGTLFPDGYSFPDSGNVSNCSDSTGNYKNTPNLPVYK